MDAQLSWNSSVYVLCTVVLYQETLLWLDRNFYLLSMTPKPHIIHVHVAYTRHHKANLGSPRASSSNIIVLLSWNSLAWPAFLGTLIGLIVASLRTVLRNNSKNPLYNAHQLFITIQCIIITHSAQHCKLPLLVVQVNWHPGYWTPIWPLEPERKRFSPSAVVTFSGSTCSCAWRNSRAFVSVTSKVYS